VSIAVIIRRVMQDKTVRLQLVSRPNGDVQLERIDPVDLRLQKPRILETHGRAPEQYSDWPDR
jgi:hypothetical protein